MTDHGFVVPPESHIIFLYFHGSLLDNWSNCFYSTTLTCLLCLQDHSLSHVQLFETMWTVAFQVPLPMDSSNKNTGADCHYPLQGMCLLLTQYYTVLIPISTVIMIMFLVYNMMCMLSCVQPFCDLMDCSQAGSSVHGIFQARILDWVAVSSSRGSSQPRDGTHVSCIGRWILYC